MSSDLDTIMGQRVRTSVKVQDLYVPANALPSRLHKFGQNLIAFTHFEDYQVRLIGSATGLSYRGTKFLTCTAHQLKDVSEENVGIIVPAKSLYISSAGYSRFRASKDQLDSDSHDLCAFDFTPQTVTHPELAQRFFKLGSNDFLTAEDDALGYFAHGCPFNDQKYDLIDEKHLGIAIRNMVCEPHDQLSDLDWGLGVCKLTSQMDFDPNGLSGGPVFAAVLQRTQIVLKFAGVINRAGNGLIYFIKAKEVQSLLDGVLNRQNSNSLPEEGE